MKVESNRTGRAVLAVALAAMFVAACEDGANVDEIRSEVGGAISELESEVRSEMDRATDEPATEAPATEAPATEATVTETVTQEATSEPEPTETPATEEATDEATNWLPLALLLLGLLVAFAIIAAIRRRRAAREAAEAELRAALGELVGTGRWVLDQGSVEVQRISEPQQLQRSWAMVRDRLVGMEERITTLSVDLKDEALVLALDELGDASQSLRSVLDGTVSLRSGPGSDPDLEADNRRAVQRRREEFGTALDRVASMR